LGGYGISELCKTEVQQLDGAIVANLDVGGLQIPMNDGLIMGGFEGLRDLRAICSASSIGIGPCAIRSASVGPSTSYKLRL